MLAPSEQRAQSRTRPTFSCCAASLLTSGPRSVRSVNLFIANPKTRVYTTALDLAMQTKQHKAAGALMGRGAKQGEDLGGRG